ncbi:nucleotide sugar dehydrogenase [[Eubacterium] cellulosolvens]
MKGLMTLSEDGIRKRFEKGEVTITVAGLGWMGLSIACLYADSGVHVLGVDKNLLIVERINKSENPLPEVGLSTLIKKNVKEGRLIATPDLEDATSQSDAILIAVPTSIDDNQRADYSALQNVAKKIGLKLIENTCVVIESTCAPGITENLVKPILEKFSGLQAENSFGLAYSPIRAMIGKTLSDIKEYPKIVGAIGPKSLRTASVIIEAVSKGGIVKVPDVKSAEAAKIFETVYRDVNIALANEFATFCEKAGIDYFEAAKAANTQPYSHLHSPSIGVGGHCLPLYPHLLLTESRSLGIKMNLIHEARRLNEDMPRHTLKLVADSLRKCNRSVARAKITVLGIAFRGNVKETRYSPAKELIRRLNRRGARITVYDPLFTVREIEAMGYKTQPSLKMALSGSHCAVITAAHDEFKNLSIKSFAAAMASPAAIVDGVGIVDPMEAEKNGLIYRGIGRGVWTR